MARMQRITAGEFLVYVSAELQDLDRGTSELVGVVAGVLASDDYRAMAVAGSLLGTIADLSATPWETAPYSTSPLPSAPKGTGKRLVAFEAEEAFPIASGFLAGLYPWNGLPEPDVVFLLNALRTPLLPPSALEDVCPDLVECHVNAARVALDVTVAASLLARGLSVAEAAEHLDVSGAALALSLSRSRLGGEEVSPLPVR